MAAVAIMIQEQGLPCVDQRFHLAIEFIVSHTGVCVFHMLLDHEPDTPHSEFSKCDYAFGEHSDYQQWRTAIKFQTGHCYTCGCPLGEQAEAILTHHERGKNVKCQEDRYLEFLRPLAYVVYHA